MVSQAYEGTWEEVAQHAGELAGHRVRVLVLDGTDVKVPVPPGMSLAEAMKDYIGSVSSGKPSNLAQRVDEAFGEIMEEKRRKWNERK